MAEQATLEAPAGTPASAAAPAQDAPITLERSSLGAWGGDVNKALDDAQFGYAARQEGAEDLLKFLAQQGYTPKQFVEYLRTPATEETPTRDATAAPTALTSDAIKALVSEVLGEHDKKVQGEIQEQQTAAQIKVGHEKERLFGQGVLEKSGFKSDTSGWTVANRVFNGCVYDAIALSLPKWASDEQRRTALAAPASEELLAKAAEIFSKTITDFSNGVVADYAAKQKGLPNATLEGGPGGRPPGKNWDNMSPQERRAALRGKP